MISMNYLVLHNLLPIRGGSECKLCGGVEYDIKRILFECTALTRVRRHVQDWLSNFNLNNFNRETIIEMKNIKDLPNYISLYKDTVWKNRRLAQLKDINEQAVIMLGLHYVPGGHGSPVSPKRSAPWDFSNFLLHIQVLLGLAKFSHGLLRYT